MTVRGTREPRARFGRSCALAGVVVVALLLGCPPGIARADETTPQPPAAGVDQPAPSLEEELRRREELRRKWAALEVVGPLVEDDEETPSIHDANEPRRRLRRTALLPFYSSVDQGAVTSAKNQDRFGTCWAFGTTAVLESSLLAHRQLSQADEADLSERHLAYFTTHVVNDPLGNLTGDAYRAIWKTMPAVSDPYLETGNNARCATNALATWAGPVVEGAAPYSDLVGATNNDPSNGTDGYEQFLERTALGEDLAYANADYHVDQMRLVRTQDATDVKQAIMEHGGVGASVCYKSAFLSLGGNPYEGKVRASYHSHGETGSNHFVELVGWDDEYLRANFGKHNVEWSVPADAGPDYAKEPPTEFLELPEGEPSSYDCTVGEGKDGFEDATCLQLKPSTSGVWQLNLRAGSGTSLDITDYGTGGLWYLDEESMKLGFLKPLKRSGSPSGEAGLTLDYELVAGHTYYVFPNATGDADDTVTVTARRKGDVDESDRPSSDGAWLAKNSWGTDWGEDGLFWISYEDAILSSDYSEVLVLEASPATELDHNYQYDGSRGTCLNYVRSGGAIANVFTAKANPAGGELLRAVSFSLESSNVDYAVQVYLNLADPADPTSGSAYFADPITGSTSYEGIYTVSLPEAVPLAEGVDFAVVVTLSHGDDSDVGYFVESTYENSFVAHTAGVRAHESFEQDAAGGPWDDLSSEDYDDPGDGHYDEATCCARVKAFTCDVAASELPPPSLGHAAVTLEGSPFACTGEAITPSVQVRYGSATLTEGEDYELSYQDNVEAGTATVTVAGIGAYTGSKTLSFEIQEVPEPQVPETPGGSDGADEGQATETGTAKKAKRANTLSAKARKAKVTVSAKRLRKKAVTLARNIKVSKAKGEVRFANASSKKVAKLFKVNARTGKVTIKKGARRGIYKLKVKVRAAGNDRYRAATKTVAYRIRVK